MPSNSGAESTADSPGIATYKIRSLADIFALPTYEHVRRAMQELTTVILEARALNDLMRETAKHLSQEDLPDLCFVFPEEVEWRDDNGGTSEVGFLAEGKEMMKIALKHAPHVPEEATA